MNRTAPPLQHGVVLAVALAIGLAAYWGTREFRSDSQGPAHHHAEASESEIAWMRQEFNLSDLQFQKVAALHSAYVPMCDQLCRQVVESARKVRELAVTSGGMSDQLADALAYDEMTRRTCRQALLHHLYQTAECMPPDQGRRFLEMAVPKVLSAQEHPDVHKVVGH